MRLKTLELNGFKSFSQKTVLEFDSSIVCVVGPNGSGKSNVVESIRYVLGEQSMKSMRGKTGADLIFKGSKSLPKGTRASVSIYFDNTDKVFKLEDDNGEDINLNYDTINITRQVDINGSNKYSLNGTEVRLKDIHNLLSSVNIGSSGHHIISQGEADRILNASPKDRKEMVEDALGLKVYQYKIKESERKLEKTELNMKEVSMLRRENAPHLNFLKKQVEKLEKVKTMQEELVVLYREYLKKEDAYLDKEKNSLHEERKKLEIELGEINKILSNEADKNSTENNPKIEELRNIERKLNEIRTLKGEMGRKLGRIEGMIEAEEHRFNNVKEVASFSKEEVQSFIEDVKRDVEEAYNKSSLEEIKSILSKIKDLLKSFGNTENHSEKERNLNEIANLKQTHGDILNDIKKLDTDEHEFIKQVEDLKLAINREMEALRDLEREKFAYKVKQQELSSALDMLSLRENSLRNRTEAFHNELKEGVSFVGQEILSYRNYEIPEGESQTQEELKRKIDRIKIKLEDSGMGNGAEIMKEFKEVSSRDEFLARELEDLSKSVETLKTMISDLKEKIDIEFKDGIKKINVEFQEFFSLMFGGGAGALSLVVENKKKRAIPEELEDEMGSQEEDEIVFEQGIEINVSLPHKKVKELHALSGGERSLTSIALLFAMSQVNPPPFLVLDETDAALDESNSRKYGDMLEKLSKHSELIVVTHNRETMSRAGMLYGVTIGSNGASKLLSIKFEEAAAIAK